MSTNAYPVLFSSTLLGATNGTVYTVQSSPTTITLQDLQLKLTNVTAATRTVTIYAVPPSGAPDPSNAVAIEMSIPPYDYMILPVERLAAGGSIQGLASAAASVNISPIGGKLHTP